MSWNSVRCDIRNLKRTSTRSRGWRTKATCAAIAGVAFVAGFGFRGQTQLPPRVGEIPLPQAEEIPLPQAEERPPPHEEMPTRHANETSPPKGKTHPQENETPQSVEIPRQRRVACSAPWASPCFDRSRCVGSDGSPKLSIYAHDFNCTNALSGEILAREAPIGHYRSVPIAALKSFRELALERGLLTERIEDACIIVYAVTTYHRCIVDTSEWNGGRNHLLVDWGDQTREFYDDVDDSAAMWAQANMQARYFRFGYDIAVPFPPKIQLDYLANIPPTKRKFFATFKGQLYLSNSGTEEREAIRLLGVNANSSDVIVVENCQERHNEHLLPENLELCQKLKENSRQQDYKDLMNTTFALIPAGRTPATFRLGEAMSAGAIPVFFHNSFVKPFPDRIPWRLCSFSFSIEEAPVVIDTLRAVPAKKLAFMQSVVLQVNENYFKGGMNGIASFTLETLESRLMFQPERVR